MKKYYIIIFILFINLYAFTTAYATSIRPISLENLSTRASLIFYGEAINNQTRKDPQSGAIATFTTFKVIDLIKGNAEEIHTIKQIGGTLSDTKIIHRVRGVPTYQIGKQYVVFLPEKSSLGFSSPLGLHQGSYSISIINNIKTVSNGATINTQPSSIIRSVTLPLAVNIKKPSQARLDDFINTVKAFNAQ